MEDTKTEELTSPRSPVPDNNEDLDKFIDSYIELSPMTSKFREGNPNLQSLEGYEPEILPSPSIDISEAEALIPETEPPQENTSSTSFLKSKLKRLSMRDSHRGNENEVTGGTNKKYSLKNAMSRSTTPPLRSQGSSHSSSHIYSADSTSSTSSFSTQPAKHSYGIENISIPFWKYHILKFGKDLYLTTNPTLKHVYCRNGPGYYVEVKSGGLSGITNTKNGFSLVFKALESLTNADNQEAVMTVTKKPDHEGGYVTMTLHRLTILQHGEFTLSDDKTFNGLSIPSVIDTRHIPDEIKDDFNLIKYFRNYEFKDFNSNQWNIGSIPRVRASKMKKFRGKVANLSNGFNEKDIETDEQEENDYLKLVGKHYTYFHQNFIEGLMEQGKHLITNDLLQQRKDLQSKNLPVVLGLFRPYESKMHKKLLRSFNNSLKKMKSGPSEPNRIKSESLDYDIGAGSEINKYYKATDGLYDLQDNSDDSPDENTLGWVTVYQSPCLEGNENKGIFDTILGLTLAIGIETYINS